MPPLIVYLVEVPDKGYVGYSYEIYVEWTRGIGPYYWKITWGDGTSDSGSSTEQFNNVGTSHVYSVAGSYKLVITVTDAGIPETGSASKTINIAVFVGVLAVTVQRPVPGYEGIPVTVTASWDTAAGPFDGVYYWGDGASDIINTTLKIISKTHTYVYGNYSIKVVVKDRNTGAQGENTTYIPIAHKLSATLSASPSSGNVPLAVTFTIGISGGYIPYIGGTLAYGDGASDPVSDSGTKAHTYTTVGTFTATLTVTDALGATIASRSKVMAGVTAIKYLVSILAPLAIGAVLIKVAR